ncbi:hypothetical protein CC78DRAFT_491467 [Lojkania enalia]|uniref:RRM domain-containing protein n=1 Tax=Lojkania enalia TaxID=147567 RepID=A0A9P4N7J4_9PLEO|nr:hypothetical protein CC78DRAFT_491467 [Didymosphaeria enalia]
MAAEDITSKKRKGVTDASPKPKKQKKSEDAAAPAKPSKALKAAVEPVDSIAANAKIPRRKAQDFFDDQDPTKSETAKEKHKKKSKSVAADTATVPLEVQAKPKKGKKKGDTDAEAVLELEVAAEAPTKSKKSKKDKASAKSDNAPVKKDKKITDNIETAAFTATKDRKSKVGKKFKAVTKEPTPELDVDIGSKEEDDEDYDQTATLLAGFESDKDDDDPAEDVGFNSKMKPYIGKDVKNELVKASKNEDKPGVVFVGRIPHGFFEPQMKKYFSQFGTVTRLRLSRNKKTGASKHYAFIEFASEEVADIVARTMDKYLLFGHILQCSVIPAEQVHENLFEGSNYRFKTMPRNQIAGREMARGVEREVWQKRIKNEDKRREAKKKKLKADFGYEYAAPALKTVDDVPKKCTTLENGGPKQLQIEALLTNEEHNNDTSLALDSKVGQPVETVKTKKSKKSEKAKIETTREPAAVIKQKPLTGKKSKNKNSKVDTAADVKPEALVEPPVADKKRKAKSTEQDVPVGKKSKKTKASKA